MNKELRVAAYAVCVREEQVLLARWVAGDGSKRWTLPGGGMDHGEDPYDTVIREVDEETGYVVDPVALLGVHSVLRRYPRKLGKMADFHGLRLVYEGAIIGGALRHEENGSTDMAAWHDLAAVQELPRVELVDVGMDLWRERPRSGHVRA
ncbi:NUDIX hydrolase [Streptomyces endophyticus]|uniref:NUDIX domain-containing protein n=1 Tax=Streptomyces endophyticus TaxID=714166 RepID=A0ABU6FJN7_9ACTN|nr:NUDIX domain-containing protein [Streptomyces endophyticus]MEB8343470.1 NUDIX domain-containing protein [Streptomyces endophyticus]